VPRWLIFVIFLALGVAMTAWKPTREILIGPIWLGFTLLLAAFVVVMVVRAWLLDRLRRRGTPAQAAARSVRETGLYVYEMPQVELELDVFTPGGSYKLTKRVVVPFGALEGLRRGDLFAVRVDPDDQDEVVFEWGEIEGPPTSWIARGQGAPAEVDLATRLKQLDELRGHSDMTDADYERLRREIEGNLPHAP
jgi:hypothetical protein